MITYLWSLDDHLTKDCSLWVIKPYIIHMRFRCTFSSLFNFGSWKSTLQRLAMHMIWYSCFMQLGVYWGGGAKTTQIILVRDVEFKIAISSLLIASYQWRFFGRVPSNHSIDARAQNRDVTPHFIYLFIYNYKFLLEKTWHNIF